MGPRPSPLTTSSSSASRRCAGSLSRRASARTALRAPAAWGRRWRIGSSTASRRSISGRWTCGASAPPIAAAPTPSHGRSRSTPPITTFTIRTRSGRPAGRCASPPPTRASRSLAQALARNPAGSGPTGSRRTRPHLVPRPRAMVRVGAGRPNTGHRRSLPNTARRASAPGCSTRRRSRRSRSTARARCPSCSSCARTTSIVLSAV